MINTRLYKTGALLLGALSVTSVAGAPSLKAPNIILIFADDLGYTAVERYGNKHVATPNLNRIADEGILFTNAYVTPQCTPSRASLLTGQYTAHNQMWHVIPGYGYPWARLSEPAYLENLPRETYTLAKALKDNNYRTAIIGKWHLTHNEDGYYTYLFEKAAKYYGFDYTNPKTEPTEYQGRGDKGVEFLTCQATKYMEEKSDKPFFIYLAHHTIHGPVLAPDSLVKKYRDKGYPENGLHSAVYLAALEHLDNSVGTLLAHLERQNLSDNTVVIFLSDNGGVDTQFDNCPLRAGKGSAYEGGIRVPFMIRWPARIKPGTVSDVPVHIVDLFPTLIEIAGGEMRQQPQLDGLSLVPLMTQSGKLKRDKLFWYMPLYDAQWGAAPSAVVRYNNYKLIKHFADYISLEENGRYIPSGRLELYDLQTDLSETNDLSAKLPALRDSMEHWLDAWLAASGSDLPSINPRYDETKALERDIK